jgi:hypothetical protein
MFSPTQEHGRSFAVPEPVWEILVLNRSGGNFIFVIDPEELVV